MKRSRFSARRILRIASSFFAGAGLIAGCLSAVAGPTQDITLTLSVGGQQRTAYLHVPANLDLVRKYPLVIGFHGGAGNAAGYIQQSQIFVKGEQAGFIVVCPQGTPIFAGGDHRVWNSGTEYAKATKNADDIAFTRALIDKVSGQYRVDRKWVYATGFSNGAQMAYRVALELSDHIAAIAPMSGGRLAEGLRPDRPVPVLHIHGTADGFYPLEGGLGPYSVGRTPHVSIRDVIAEWCKFNGAQLAPRSVRYDGWEMRVHDGLAAVNLVLVNGMGHQIAGGSNVRLPHQEMRDKPDAVAMALEFFATHPIP